MSKFNEIKSLSFSVLDYNSSLKSIYLKTFNSILNLGILATLISGLVHFSTNKSDIFFHNLIVAILLSLPKILLRRESIWWSGVTFIFIVDSILLFYSMILGPIAGIHNLFIITTIIPLILGFNFRTLALSLLSLTCFVYLHLTDYHNPFPFTLKQSDWNDFYSSLLVISTFMGLIFILHKTHLSTLKALDEERLKTYNASRLASLADLSGAIAHEMNNPLAILVGKIEILKMKISAGRLTEHQIQNELALIETTVGRVCQTVKTMTDLISSENYNSTFNLVEVIQHAISITQRLSLGVDFFFENNSIQEATVSGNAPQMTQALLNLLFNAKEAATKSEAAWVKVELSLNNNLISQIRIIDSGPRISSINVNKIMEPFFTTKKTGKSAGLGLPIAKRIIEKHQGQLQYEPSHPHTSFIIHVPLIKENSLRRVA